MPPRTKWVSDPDAIAGEKMILSHKNKVESRFLKMVLLVSFVLVGLGMIFAETLTGQLSVFAGTGLFGITLIVWAVKVREKRTKTKNSI